MINEFYWFFLNFQLLILFVIVLNPSTCEKLRSLYNFGADSIYANSEKSSSGFDVCNRMAIKLLVSVVRVHSLLLVAFTILVGLPFYKLFHNEHELVVPIILPFVDPNTQNGFYINTVNQMVHLCIGSLSIPIHNLFVCILKNNMLVTAAVIENSLNEFKMELENDKRSAKKMMDFWEFRNIIGKILDYHK